MLNPMSVLFAAAVFLVIFRSDMAPMDNAIVVLNHLLVEMVFYTALAYGMNTAAVRTKYLKAKVYTDRTASVILGALGLRLMVGR